MKRPLLIVRPEPGASMTAELARARGWEAVAAPLFAVRPLSWPPPRPEDFDALLLTSANAARCGGEGLRRFAALPTYAVGEKTAAAARAAGLTVAAVAGGNAAGAAALLRAACCRAVLHLAGAHVRQFDSQGLEITRISVYVSEAVSGPGRDFEAVLSRAPVTLIHSARAGAAFARWVGEALAERSTIALAGISRAALAPAGEGWGEVAVAARPDDAALLEAAAHLCVDAAIR